MVYLQKIGRTENLRFRKISFELIYRESLKESGKVLSGVNDIKVKDTEDRYVVLELCSGIYHFVIQK